MLRSYINCEHLIILTCKFGSKTIVLRSAPIIFVWGGEGADPGTYM